jgi:alcohol dehydrogenase class IV
MKFQNQFAFYRTPKVIFGTGEVLKIGLVSKAFGKKCILVHSLSVAKNHEIWHSITNSLITEGVHVELLQVSGEPSPELVDNAVASFKNMDFVIAIGGGSVIDAGKAIAAMYPVQEPVIDFLEVVGKRKPDGRKIPFIAIPTTSGTGSEASANAVLSKIGVNGFKRSLRHDNYVPDIALIDPELSLSCPADITAACGMDALTQLIESYTSTKASPITDSLVESALPLVKDALVTSVTKGSDIAARTAMAYASFISGITLANAGLGVVHGLASIFGSIVPIPHGVVCGTLLPSALKYTINKLRITSPDSVALKKFANTGRLLTGSASADNDACDRLIDTVYNWVDIFSIPRLSAFGIKDTGLSLLIKENPNKNNAVQLTETEIIDMIKERI